jgi:N-acetylglucosamine-6-sulfatase
VTGLLAGALACAALSLRVSGQESGVASPAQSQNPAAAPPEARPNFLVITTDDQRMEQMRALPKTERLVGRRGTRFRDAIITTPQCCPARASWLTGQYGHNHGILSNAHGYPALAEPRNVLPVWLRRAGYATAHLGKFLNGYEKAVGANNTVGPGWDEWATLIKPRRYLNYELQVNGGSVRYGTEPSDYLTKVLNKRAARLIRKLGAEEDPFYIQLDHYAPHKGKGDPSGRCGGSTGVERGAYAPFSNRPLPSPKSFNERAMGDKPVFLQRRPLITAAEKKAVRKAYRCGLASLSTVDEGVKKLIRLLRSNELLKETVVIFTSDNGLFYGEHRSPGTKNLPY